MSKPLDHICWNLAAKVLGEPGTIVEKARGAGIGRLYKVVGSKEISLRFEDGTTGYADFFRKAECQKD